MNYVIIDVETTGGSPKNSKITELAMYKYDGEKIIDEFITLVNPEMQIPEFIVRFTGINDRMVAQAPKFFEIAKQIIDFTADCIFVAHNVAFDYGMFRGEFKALGYDFRKPHLCTVRASRVVIPGHASYSLGKITRELGIEIQGRHRAGGDALATTKLFEIIYHKDPNNLSTFIQEEVNPKRIHPNLSIETIDELPLKTGVYFFHNEFNQIIYIGKSISIKKRVEQHLRNTKTARGIKMIQSIVHVSYEVTGSEIISLLRESELIKAHKPIYNRQLKRSLYPFGLFDHVDENGYINLRIESIAKNPFIPLAHFSSKKDGVNYLMNCCERRSLCQKLCFLYQSQDQCFHYDIKQCKGACIREESAHDYNARVDALIKQITFEGKSFYIIDKGRDKIEKSVIWIEKGIYQGYGFAPYHFHGKTPNDWSRYITIQKENKDIKSILNIFLRKENKLKIIEL